MMAWKTIANSTMLDQAIGPLPQFLYLKERTQNFKEKFSGGKQTKQRALKKFKKTVLELSC